MTTTTQLAQEYFDILQGNPIFDDDNIDRFAEITTLAEQDPELAELLAKIDYDFARQTVTSLAESRIEAMRQQVMTKCIENQSHS